MMSTARGWGRRFPNTGNNLDLVLENSQDLDSARLKRIAI
jgi:hypothetical protein